MVDLNNFRLLFSVILVGIVWVCTFKTVVMPFMSLVLLVLGLVFSFRVYNFFTSV